MTNCSCFNHGSFTRVTTNGRDGRVCSTRGSSARSSRGSTTSHSHDICGHGFQTKTFIQPRFCSQCHSFIWGFARQGYQCKECDLVIHKRCFAKTLPVCRKAEDSALPRFTWDQLVYILNNTSIFEKSNVRELNVQTVPLTS